MLVSLALLWLPAVWPWNQPGDDVFCILVTLRLSPILFWNQPGDDVFCILVTLRLSPILFWNQPGDDVFYILVTLALLGFSPIIMALKSAMRSGSLHTSHSRSPVVIFYNCVPEISPDMRSFRHWSLSVILLLSPTWPWNQPGYEVI